MDQPIFLRSSWYVAAFDGKIDQTPLARTLLNEPIVLNRTVDGTVIALEDRCCQRALPLPLGKIVGEKIQCGYHGLMFVATGACIDVPANRKFRRAPKCGLSSGRAVELGLDLDGRSGPCR